MAQEKRKERRVHAEIEVEITCFDESKRKGVTTNFSRLGALITIDREFKPGESVDLALMVPGHFQRDFGADRIRCKANVFRCSPLEEGKNVIFAVGVFFTEFFSQEDAAILSHYVSLLLDHEDSLTKSRAHSKKEKQTKITPESKEEELNALQLALQSIASRLDKIEDTLKKILPQ